MGWLRRLDERVLGERGIAIVSCALAVLLALGSVAAFIHGAWGRGIFYSVATGWVAYWARRRVNRLLRTAPRQ